MRRWLPLLVFAGGCQALIDVEDCDVATDCGAGFVCQDRLCIPSGGGLGIGTCEGTIVVRVLADLTGPTSDVGVPFYQAELDLIREINESGGIRGCAIEVEARDYAYDPAAALTIYEDWKAQPSWSDVATIFGWGSGDSLALAPLVEIDEKPFLSASYIGGLASPMPVEIQVNVPEFTPAFGESTFPQQVTSDGHPYNFFSGTDYSTAIRIAMFHAQTRGAKRVGFFACSAAYCTGPLPAARTYAKEIGLDIGRSLVLELSGTEQEYVTAIRAFFEAELRHRDTVDPDYEPVDWVWSGNTTKTTAYMARAIAEVNKPVAAGGLGLSVQLVVNNWGFDEDLYSRCPNACPDVVHGIMPFLAYGDARARAMADVVALHDKWRAIDSETQTYKNVRYVQGYVNVLMFRLAAERVIDGGQRVTGPTIKAALETFDKVDTGGLTARLSFSPEDHRPQSTESIYRFGPDGALVNEPPDRTIVMDPSWLGW